MDARKLESTLRASLAHQFESITVLDVIDSTNAEAIRRMLALQESSQLIVGLSQSAGRGRRGRRWMSPPGAGLYISLTRAFNRPLAELQGLSLITALSVAEAIREIGVSEVKLKWPNDVLVDGKKLAGILLETCQNGNQTVIVFGVGININLPDAILEQIDRPVTDVCRELGVESTDGIHASVLLALCASLESKFDRFSQQGFSPFRDHWNAIDAYLQQDVLIMSGEHEIRGIYDGVDDSGALVLTDHEQRVRTIKGGEVFPTVRSLQELAQSGDALDAGVHGDDE